MIQIVDIPPPTPIGQPAQTREVPAIPDDILQEIVSYLPIKTRAVVSVLSQHVHGLISNVPLDIEGQSASQVSRLHQFIFQDPARPLYIRSVTFPQRLNPQDPSESGTCARQAIEIIQAAHRLHKLRFTSDLGSYLLPQHTAFLSQLVDLTINPTLDQIYTPGLLPRTLQTITLGRNTATIRSRVSTKKMLKTLSRLPLLNTIILNGIPLQDPALYGDDVYHDLDLPSVHTLRVKHTSLPSWTCIPALFPNLRTLALANSPFFDEGWSDSPGTETTLHHLVLKYASEAMNVPWPGLSRLTFAEDANDWESEVFYSCCDTSTLVALTLESVKVTYVEAPIWTEDMRLVVPHLRLLEVESVKSSLTALVANFVVGFSGSDYLPLLCLSLLGCKSRVSPEVASARRMELFECVVKNIPSLRYVALAEIRPPRIMQETDFAGTRAPWRWWKIIREDGAEGSTAKAVEIPAWEGERVRAFLRDANLEAAKNFDERFVPLR
ncbi:hypothetical protein C8Q80DRAFT_1276216 [Daedaleopsis nitida]|nr:hypothetical protein C8Q80DRAFT_1276216 [Daedaleopsis nitida]